MARDAVTITDLAFNSGLAGTTTAISVANGAVINAGTTDNLVLVLTNAESGELDVTIAAGVGPLAALGPVVVPVAGSSTEYVVLESAMVVQADGAIHLDFEATMTGTVAALRLPAGV